MLQAAKDRFRRWQLRRRRIIPQLTIKRFTSGERSGVWTVCPDFLNKDSIVYSFGVGDNTAWDLAMISQFGLTIHAFDPTPASVQWVSKQNFPSNFHFHPVGLAGHDGTLVFKLPKRGSRFNYRSSESLTGRNVRVAEAPVCRLATHMARLGHDHLDILKLDIEGAEFAALEDFLMNPIPVKQLLIEFHHHFRGIGIKRTVRTVRKLQAAGYKIFHISERGLEMSLVHDA